MPVINENGGPGGTTARRSRTNGWNISRMFDIEQRLYHGRAAGSAGYPPRTLFSGIFEEWRCICETHRRAEENTGPEDGEESMLHQDLNSYVRILKHWKIRPLIIIAGLACGLVCMICPPSTYPAAQNPPGVAVPLHGDVNNDGRVDHHDAVYLAGILTEGHPALAGGDLDADGRIDLLDLYRLEMLLATEVTDAGGNVYNTVRIGGQIWMAENLRTSRFNDGQPIPDVTGNAAWGSLRTPGYSWGSYNPAYRTIYGPWYNWYAVQTGKLAPAGWHIPDIAEWRILAAFLGGESIAGGKMKVPGTTHWFWPNTGATNESGFSAYPPGYRNYDGVDFNLPGDLISFWTTDECDARMAFGTRLLADSRALMIYDYGVSKNYGYSIRCVKDR